MHYHRFILLLGMLALMSGCASVANIPPSASTPPAAPTVTSTSAPLPDVASIPTTQPTPDRAVLPAPLYILAGGQIVRIERDGVTQTQITTETPPAVDALAIVAFDIAPATATLVYVVQNIDKPPLLIRTDADGNWRSVLLDDRFVSFPLLSPDGSTVAFSAFDEGLYVMPVAGGEPRLILPNQPVTDLTVSGGDGRGFAPAAWSPNGARLLVHAYSLTVERCELAVVDLSSGAITYLKAPELIPSCATAAWSADSQSIYFSVVNPSNLFNEPGLWQGNAVDGISTALPLEPANVLVRAPFATQERLYAFVTPFPAQVADLDVPPYPEMPFTMSSVSLTGGLLLPLRNDAFTLYQTLWADNGSGAVIFESSDPMQVRVLWVPANGDPTVELYRGQDIYEIAWGRAP